MFTVRDFTSTANDLALALQKIAAIGYPAVQLSGVAAMNGPTPEVSVKNVKEMLDQNDLVCAATHRDWQDLLRRTDEEIEFHKALGCTYVAVGGIPSQYRAEGYDGFRRWIDEAIVIAGKLRDAGIQFGYHNHDFEFEKSLPGRSSFYNLLIAEGGDDLMLELDIYWAQNAGVDPTALIERLSKRVPVVHLKDKEVLRGKVVMAPVGEGNLDWQRILPALKSSGTQWYCVEQDECQRDPFDCLRSSYEYLSHEPGAAY